jgi:hypothetical protein
MTKRMLIGCDTLVTHVVRRMGGEGEMDDSDGGRLGADGMQEGVGD